MNSRYVSDWVNTRGGLPRQGLDTNPSGAGMAVAYGTARSSWGATLTGLAGNLCFGVLGKAIHRQVPGLRTHSNVTQECGGRDCLGACALSVTPHSEAIRRGSGQLLDNMGPLKIQKLGSRTAFQERRQALEKLHPAGIWQTSTAVHGRDPPFTQCPSSTLYNDNI